MIPTGSIEEATEDIVIAQSLKGAIMLDSSQSLYEFEFEEQCGGLTRKMQIVNFLCERKHSRSLYGERTQNENIHMPS